ncbi:hypothetical protein [Clostridium magnum]|uniref:Uncharacterized protein n=1 Tax=Clostridium magnum DSM 2767 TaxID=1121326 RepID=A0A161X3U2_9CLOT|nr:hypothetical protein [Clostridium magnum]KZL88476.1 hypothetical protein CLMAG_62480 [Clostridium magnum DSM 2767]SHI89934.1 hypothetical protein SAMN02745944_05026 [Clostridium magnum DSM 2767]
MVYSCIENDYPLTLVKEEGNNYGKKKERKFHLQMDKILKRLFTLKNTNKITGALSYCFRRGDVYS